MLCIEEIKTRQTKLQNEGMRVVGFTCSVDGSALRISPGCRCIVADGRSDVDNQSLLDALDNGVLFLSFSPRPPSTKENDDSIPARCLPCHEADVQSRCLCIFCRRSPGDEADGWSDMPPADTVACCGMARAAEWLYREVRDARVALTTACSSRDIQGVRSAQQVVALECRAGVTPILEA